MDPLDLQLLDLSKPEREALSAYKTASDDADGKSRCFELNRQLEHALLPGDMGHLGQTVTLLDGIFARCIRLAAPLTVYRAIGLRLHYPFSETGRRFRNLSFWSTSVRRDVAVGFLKADMVNACGALLRLELPIGLPACNLETLEGSGGSEHEILLPRNVMWTVQSIEPFDMGELLPHAAKKFANIIEVSLAAHSDWEAR